MNFFELTQLPINDFKNEFSKISDNRFTDEEEGYKILHYALYNLNVDVVLYLLENHPYDLELEMNRKIDDVYFKNKLPFVPINEGFYERKMVEEYFNDEIFERYKRILNILRDNNIYPEMLTENTIEQINASKNDNYFLKNLTTEPLLSYYLENNLIDSNYLLRRIPVLANWNKKGEYVQSIESNVLDKTLSKVKFNFELIDKNTFINIISLNKETLNVSSSIYNDFKEKLKAENNIEYDDITNDIFLKEINKISVSDGRNNHHNFFENIEKIDQNGGSSRTLSEDFKKMAKNFNSISEKTKLLEKRIILSNLDLNGNEIKNKKRMR